MTGGKAPITYRSSLCMDNQISKYDRLYGGLIDVSLHTKPSTVKVTQPITGQTETFIIQTVRHDENGDYIFIERADESGLVRMVLPPKVSTLIGSQKDSLNTKRRRIGAKKAMSTRIARGDVIDFKKRSGVKR